MDLPRKPRVEHAGAVYYVMSWGILDERDCELYELWETLKPKDWPFFFDPFFFVKWLKGKILQPISEGTQLLIPALE
jgi:hypothetical protein